MLSGIYQILCLSTGKRYIGSSVNIERRFLRHRTELRAGTHRNPKLQAAWNKYGEGAFTFDVIEAGVSAENLLSREQFYIVCHGELNCVLVAGGAPLHGKKHSPETRKKMRAAWRRRKARGLNYRPSLETREKMRLAALGRRHSPESRAKMSRAAKRRPPPSEETRRKIGEKSRGNTYAAGSGAKVSLALRGRKLSTQHCSNISAALHKAYAEGRR